MKILEKYEAWDADCEKAYGHLYDAIPAEARRRVARETVDDLQVMIRVLSDHYKTPWGRRRPWFFVGALPLAVSFIAMFSADPAWSQTQLFFWLLATNILFWVGTTTVIVPHAAFASEMTETHQERISVMGWREGFLASGLITGGFAMFVTSDRSVRSKR